MTIYLYLGDDNIYEGWSSTPSENTVEAEIDENEPLLMKIGKVKYIDGSLIQDIEREIEELRQIKDKELNKRCESEILKGFEFEIEDIAYTFSYDLEAQSNLQLANDLFNKDLITEIKLTAKRNGEYHRVTLNKEQMNSLLLAAFQHKETQISWYRDNLFPLLQNASTIEELQTIVWEEESTEEPIPPVEEPTEEAAEVPE